MCLGVLEGFKGSRFYEISRIVCGSLRKVQMSLRVFYYGFRGYLGILSRFRGFSGAKIRFEKASRRGGFIEH